MPEAAIGSALAHQYGLNEEPRFQLSFGRTKKDDHDRDDGNDRNIPFRKRSKQKDGR
jgi:hypothetical protein